MSRGVVGEDVGDALCATAGALGPEPPSGSAARLTARACGRGNLYISARFPTVGGSQAAERISELLVSVPPRRSAQDGASDEELMLPLENRGRQGHGAWRVAWRRVATGDKDVGALAVSSPAVRHCSGT